ncbi:polyprenyl synthetase family protein [Allonocardiopsis opalescens]|uniref:Heptaprenyl diphosphate synthase n=1 Tax=Allonocardiopsis opalescens TaxID=1144618 RepID=A0A2T0Q7V1_9ACTN|nr:polyprenyl synthetase family protein [Allonocardiopsis opalescens]PRX99927.1 heptaprenyl diphosphate synthase [Allonocardiopsis opalescens]
MSSAVPNDFFGMRGIPPALAAELGSGLERVEHELRSRVRSDDGLVDDASRHLITAGGKRFRPMVTLLAAQFGDPGAAAVVHGAVVIELTHLATLYHDDVMDEAELRRGSASANSRWGNTVAILTGDYLFARASELLADLGADAVRIQARTFARLVRGQIRETVGPADGTDRVEHYLGVVADKTASLIATAATFGGMFAGAPAAVTATLTRACEALGVAFQLSDDILDVASESVESGKVPGTDLREGVLTLPVLHALADTSPDGARLRELLGAPGALDDDQVTEALTLLRKDPAMDAARADLLGWVERARAELRTLPHIPARDAFEALCEFVVVRTG